VTLEIGKSGWIEKNVGDSTAAVKSNANLGTRTAGTTEGRPLLFCVRACVRACVRVCERAARSLRIPQKWRCVWRLVGVIEVGRHE